MRRHVLAIAAVAALSAACSSGSSPAADSSSAAGSPSAPTSGQSVTHYLDAVNALCDALLPKVIAVTNAGSMDIPLKAFFAQLPAHMKLRSDFDRQLAAIPVPPAAADKAATLAAYIRFANALDARRLAAAKQGQ